jgi:hypothetical protein
MPSKHAYLVAALLTLSLSACSDPQPLESAGNTQRAGHGCFSGRPTIILPDKAKALAHASHGSAGRAIVDAIFARNVEAVMAQLAADPKLATSQVQYDPKMPQRPDGQYGDLLTLAVAQCDLQMVQNLLRAGLSPDGEQKGEALTLALLADTLDLSMLLLQAGATPDPQKTGGRDVLREMIMFGHAPAISLLVRHGLDVHWVDRFGVGRLQVAVDTEQFHIAEILADAGASLWSISGSGHMPVHILNVPMIQINPQQDSARSRLLAKAKLPGLPWPPPTAKEVRAFIAEGNWPTPALQKAGIPALTPEALADMKQRYTR